MITREQIPSFPRGWKILNSWEPDGDPRSGIVLCQREDTAMIASNYVTWCYNRIEGGCFWGHYLESESKARTDFANRVSARKRS